MTPSDRASAAFETFQILKGTAMNLGAGGREGPRLVVRTAEAEHLMSGGDQVLHDGGADPTRRASDKHAHEQVSGFRWRQISSLGVFW